MTQLSQLSEAEIEARFHITGARPVGFLLAGYAKESVQFSIQFGAGADLFLGSSSFSYGGHPGC